MLDSTQLPTGTATPDPIQVSFPEPTEPTSEPTETVEEPAAPVEHPTEEPEPTPEPTEPAPQNDPIEVSFPDGSTLPKE